MAIQTLIVDDNSMSRKLVSMLLKSMGCVTDEAASGKECLEKVTEKTYDIIFMDYLMPEMNGVETLTQMKKLESSLNQNTPVVALTADELGNGGTYYEQFGFDEYLIKPVVPQKLQNLIAKVCKK